MDAFDKAIDSMKNNPGGLSAPERFFDSIGLMRSSWSPLGRAAVGGAVGFLIVQGLKPRAMYREDGTARVWKLQGGDTYFPWWTVPVTGAIVCGLCI